MTAVCSFIGKHGFLCMFAKDSFERIGLFMKNWFFTNFSFSRKELQGIAFLTSIIVVLWLLPTAYRLLAPREVDAEFAMRKRDIINFIEQNRPTVDGDARVSDSALSSISPEYFTFDPNTLSAEEGKRLGLTDVQSRMIHNYREKGGRFYRKEDFAKIYAMTEEDYQRLAPFIQIASVEFVSNVNAQTRDKNSQQGHDAERVRNSRVSFERPSKDVMINLNTTDSIELLDLYGIGPAFAARIIKYRDLLGGYHSKEQLLEVYGMDEERYEGFESHVFVDSTQLQKIPINTIGYRELLKHPYITPRQANTVVQYRIQHGHYQKATDLLEIEILDEDFLRKIAPYLSFELEEEPNHADNRKEITQGHS